MELVGLDLKNLSRREYIHEGVTFFPRPGDSP
jgi:hypothetical protein